MLRACCFAFVLLAFGDSSGADLPFVAPLFNATEWNLENLSIRGNPRTVTVEVSSSTIVKRYDPNGQMTRSTLTAGGSRSETRLEYNDRDQLVEVSLFLQGAEQPLWVEKATYDDSGKIESVSQLRQGRSTTSKDIIYDDEGHLKSISTSNSEWQFKFDGAGRLQQRQISLGGNPGARAIFRNYNNGYPGKLESYKGDRLILVETYEYEFDDEGNWIKMTSNLAMYGKQGKRTKEHRNVTRRSIAYY